LGCQLAEGAGARSVCGGAWSRAGEWRQLALLTANPSCSCPPGRSFCAVALLAACGLAVPAAAASVPYIDAFMLRNFSGGALGRCWRWGCCWAGVGAAAGVAAGAWDCGGDCRAASQVGCAGQPSQQHPHPSPPATRPPARPAGDSPAEGVSAFALEMREMGALLGDVGPHSLVLVDELGKGTEVGAAGAVGAAVVEQLVAARCR
jgi:hypothetical protein